MVVNQKEKSRATRYWNNMSLILSDILRYHRNLAFWNISGAIKDKSKRPEGETVPF